MLAGELETFKTKKCQVNHCQRPLSALRLDCVYYHSRQDKRRSPFGVNGGSRGILLYSEMYVEDYYSTQMVSNMVEYLFHPNVYKTVRCRDRFKYKFEDGEQVKDCQQINCPYIHQGQDIAHLQIIRNLPVYAPLQDEAHSKIEACTVLADLIKYKTSQRNNFRDSIDQFKLKLKEIARKTEQNINAQQKPFAATALLQQKPPQICKAAQMKEQLNWYHQYHYFHFGQRLPVIEDRHHEFKNYRDIVNKDIAPIVVKYIAAFLNSDGGVLYVGVDDNSVVYGFQMMQHQFDRFLLNVDAEGKRSLLPPLLPHKYSIRRIPVYYNKKGKQLWVVEIKVTPTEKHKKQKILTTYNRELFIRMNASTQKLDAFDLIQYIRYQQEQKHEERKPMEMAEELSRSLESKEKMHGNQQLGELREKLMKVVQRVDELAKKKDCD